MTLVSLLIKLSLISSSTAPVLFPSSPCAELIGSCEYYSCVEEQRISCGEQGYPLGFGLNYCNKFSEIEFRPAWTPIGQLTFPQDGNLWRDHVRTCLQESMEEYLNTTEVVSCSSLRTFAFDSHPRCYTNGPSYCDLSPESVVRVGLTIAPKDLISAESQKQIRETAQLCSEHLSARLATESNYRVRIDLAKYRLIWNALALDPQHIEAGLSAGFNPLEE